MKAAVIKLGARISFNANDTSGGNGEARSIIKILKGGGADVQIFTKILKKDNLLPEYRWQDMQVDIINLITEVNKNDVLIVINGSVNYFGGQEDREQTLNYALINHFKGKVFYTYCDPELTLKQVWSSVSKKEWGTKYDEKDILISRNDIIYLSQPHDIKRVVEDFKKGEIIPKVVVHFPFEQFPCLNEQLPFNPNPEVDLSYGGTMRGGKRSKKMVKFYFGHPEDISVEMFGKIDLEDFDVKLVNGLKPPKFTGPVRYDEMLPKMNKAMAHCVIGDPYYEQLNDMSQRGYESIWSNVVTFIDADMDKLRRVYGTDKILSEFLYVSSREELSEKIRLLKSDESLRKQILEDQLKAINFDAKKYCESFVNQVKALI